eukprot:scaffold2049_cov19-Tisochrysis_lutea.AAC.1
MHAWDRKISCMCALFNAGGACSGRVCCVHGRQPSKAGTAAQAGGAGNLVLLDMTISLSGELDLPVNKAKLRALLHVHAKGSSQQLAHPLCKYACTQVVATSRSTAFAEQLATACMRDSH